MSARARNTLLWFGVFGAPLAWTLQLVLGYGLEEAACAPGSRDWGVDGDVWEVVISAGAAAAAVAAGLGVLAIRRRSAPDPNGRIEFLVVVGLLLSALFLTLIVLTGAGVLALGSCRAG